MPDPLSDFELAPLSTVDPSLLVRDPRNRVDQLFLALALIFNDLKGISWLHLQLAQRPPDDPKEISGYNGQRQGMLIQSIRMTAAIIHELLELLRRFDDTLGDPEVRTVLATVDGFARKQWRELVALAQGKKRKSSELAKALMKVRHVTFHYYNPAGLAAGYEKHFCSGRTDPGSTTAYYSDGENMERTRFYYADAAAHRMLEGMGSLSGGRDPAQAVAETARIVSEAIKPILIEFIRQRKRGRR